MTIQQFIESSTYMPRNLIMGRVVIRLLLQTMFISSVDLFLVLNWMERALSTFMESLL